MSVDLRPPTMRGGATFLWWIVNVFALVPVFALTAWCWPALTATYALALDPTTTLETVRAAVTAAPASPVAFAGWVADVLIGWTKAVVALGGVAMIAIGVDWTVRGAVSFLPGRRAP